MTRGSDAVVVDASAWVDLLLGEPRGARVADRLEDQSLHAPAHIDLELLSVFRRIERAGVLTPAQVDARLRVAHDVPIRRHTLADLADGAWRRRANLRISDALYVELAVQLDIPLITTDRRLARATPHAEAI
jgi:predicted nucleic acid-binding protein